MSPEINPPTSRICPTCGTRVTEDAVRCVVCGAELGTAEKPAQAEKAVQGSRMPTVTLSLPIAIGLLAVFLAIGASLVYFALRSQPEVIIPPTETPTITPSLTPSITVTLAPPTPTDTPQPTPTPQTYYVQENDTCLGIAAFFGVSVNSIVLLNNLPAACDTLYINQPLLIPYPTPTVTPLPSATLGVVEQTEAACEKISYVVQATDTLGSISSNYGVPMEAIREENGLPGDTVYEGTTIIIPLCRRYATPGPTSTPTLPPPYPAPNLLLPADGSAFTVADDSISLQWASVGTLRDNEAYAVFIVDVTAGEGTTLTDYVTDTKYLAPSTLRPTDNQVHIFRWWIAVVRQSGSDENGNPIWESAGTPSTPRVFSWSGIPGAPTPTP
ncbi:MAG: LysM peptidoglycan-binding domain-containing protein [Anaerolineales bacterium]|nr:LysM peptidoglycan-binding domain-containing protein [Anaerolineales bacterium]